MNQLLQTFEFLKQRLPLGTVSLERTARGLTVVASKESREHRFLRTRLASLEEK